jgi:hypothetical protein
MPSDQEPRVPEPQREQEPRAPEPPPEEVRIEPHDGWLGDPAVPTRVGAPPVRARVRPAFGITPISGWLTLLAAGAFLVGIGAGISTGSVTVHALFFWGSIMLALFAAAFFIWVDPLPKHRFIAVPLATAASFGVVLLQFLLLALAPVWLGWVMVFGGLLLVAVGLVPLSVAWVDADRRDANDFKDAELV